MKKQYSLLLMITVLLSGCSFIPTTSIPSTNSPTSIPPATDNPSTSMPQPEPPSSIVLPSTPIIPPSTSITPPPTTIIPPSSSINPPPTSVIPPPTTIIPPSSSAIPPSTSVTPPPTTVIPPSTSVTPPSSSSAKPPASSNKEHNALEVDPLAGNYYSSINLNTTDKRKLKTSLGSLIKSTHKSISYAGLWTAYKDTDLKPGTNYIWDIYSNVNFTYASKQCGSYKDEGDCYNREHSVPKSWFGEATPMYSDIFHLYPTDGKVNGMRSNYAYGNVASATYTSKNGSKLGSAKSGYGYNGKVFEPIDEYKGDLARTYFYFVTRYEGISMFSGDGSVHFTPTTSATFGLSQYSINLLLEWAEKDPISKKEIDRNQAIFLKVQKNRNPFIDIPKLADFIWGSLRK